MISSQLSRQIARHLAVDDASNLNSDAALDVVNAINSGLHRFFTEAPAIYKRTTLSATFKAPINLSLTFTGQYENTVTGTPFDPEWYGCGIKADSMAKDNEILGVSSVLDQWLPAVLETQAQVLFDCQPIPATIERITSDIRSYESDQQSVKILHRDTTGIIDHRRHYNSCRINENRPQFYRIEPTAIVAGGSTSCLLRIHPAPVVDTIVRFEAEISAVSLTIRDLLTGTIIPIADAWIPLLIPLCEDALTYSPIWKDPKTKKDIRDNATSTIENRIKKLPRDFGCPDNQVARPWGF